MFNASNTIGGRVRHIMKPLRPRKLDNGTIVYPKRGLHPPPPIPGYYRKSDNPRSFDAWIFLPDWKACPFRAEELIQRKDASCCNCLVYSFYCTHPEEQGLVINTTICESCKHERIA